MGKKLADRRGELRLRRLGYGVVAGVDEVGRGPAAGPVTVAAVVLPERCRLGGLTDSKLLPVKERERLAREIRRQAVAVGIGWTGSADIDRLGLTVALRNAAHQAVRHMGVMPDAIMLDGTHNYLTLGCHTACMAKGDQTNLCVAAASVVAKVARDHYMELLHRAYGQYGFDRHKGYLTSDHIAALEMHGPSPVHRLRWKTLQAYAAN